MAVLYSALIFASVILTFATGITITNEDPFLPSQQVLDDGSFIRILQNNENEVIQCPNGTYLDKTSVTCQFINLHSGTTIPTPSWCPPGQIGDFVNPENCRSFISCGFNEFFTVFCPSNLLYNQTTKQCDWPREAGCCEFIENNSSRLLQNSE